MSCTACSTRYFNSHRPANTSHQCLIANSILEGGALLNARREKGEGRELGVGRDGRGESDAFASAAAHHSIAFECHAPPQLVVPS